MKLETVTRETTTVGAAGQAKEFTINASVKAMQILSKGLYSDVILTVIRELGSNAYDAMIEAGTADQQFDVQLPNILAPEFRIRDYGTGLSFDSVMNLYSQFFFSTKTQTNDQVGVLGLGSKSPFGYTDGFSVISYFEGEKMFFNCNVGENGIPSITHIHTCETDEPNGLEISLAVKQSDFGTFEDRASRLWRHYNPKPNVLGASDEFQIEEREYLLEGSDWKIFRSVSYHRDSPIAVMGFIDYPVDYDKLVGVTREEKNKMYDMPIEIQFNIGDLDIASSRESLSYDERTSRNIVDKTLAAVDELVVLVQAEFKSCKTMWEARLKYAEYKRDNDAIVNVLNRAGSKPKFQGEEVKTEFSIRLYGDDEFSEEMVISRFAWETTARSYDRAARHQRFKRSFNSNDTVSIRANGGWEFFVDDLDRGAPARLKNYVAENPDTKVLLLQKATAAEKQHFMDLIGIKTLTKVSTIEVAPKASSGQGHQGGYSTWTLKSKSLARKNFYYGDRNTFNSYMDVNSRDIDLTGGGYYITTSRGTPTDMERFDTLQTLQKLIRVAVDMGLVTNDEPVICVNKSNVKKMQKVGTWVNLMDAMPTAIKTKIATADFLASYTLKDVHGTFDEEADECKVMKSVTNVYKAEILQKILNKFVEKLGYDMPEITKTLKDIELIAEAKNNEDAIELIRVYEFVAGAFDIDMPTNKLQKLTFSTEMDNLATKYPLLDYMIEEMRNEYEMRENLHKMDQFVKYIEMVDNSK